MRSNINLDLQRQIAGRVRSSESRIFQVFALLGVSHKAIAETLDKSAPTITQWSKGNTPLSKDDFAALVSLARFCLTAARKEVEQLAETNDQKLKLLSDDVSAAEALLGRVEEAAS